MFFRKIADEVTQLGNTQKELLALCAAIEKRLVHTEERLIHVEERMKHVEERLKIVDEDKAEDMRARLIHIEDKNNRLLEAERLKYNRMASADSSSFYRTEDFQYDYGIFGMWFTQNYGAALTSYALYKILEQSGYSAVLIDLPKIGEGWKQTANFMDTPDKLFVKEHAVTTEILDIADVSWLNSICDSFIYGSDSLWGGGYEYQLYILEGVLFGSKISDGKHIVSFSTSFGSWEGTGCNSAEQLYVSMLLKRFHHISVREKSKIALCEKEFGIKASWTLDPVWLLPAEEYEKVMDFEAGLPDRFIFAYILQPLPDKIEMVKYLSDKLGEKVVFVSDMRAEYRRQFGDFQKYDFIYYNTMAVSVWLTAVKTADMVITDSYHGMCFSMILKKQFFSLYPRDGMSRFTDMQRFLNISNRIAIKSVDELEEALSRPVDYVQMEECLNKKIEHDRKELSDALKKTDTHDADVSVKELERVILAKNILKKLD